MKQAKISELKNNLSQYLAYVRKGGIVRVMDRDRAVAELVPLAHRQESHTPMGEVLQDLERKGIVRRGTGSLPEDFLDSSLPKARASVLQALLDERRGSR